MPHKDTGGYHMDIRSCPSCWGTNLDATETGTELIVICYDCGEVHELKPTGLVSDYRDR